MSKDPAVLFYTNDFLSRTFTMTDEQVGKYIRLLCIQHQQGNLTEQDMLNICKTYDVTIYSKFTKEGEVYYNERMRFETERRKNYSNSRKENRKGNKDNIISQSYDNHMGTETETINVISPEDDNLTVNNTDESFEYFWNSYDKKVGKTNAKSQWKKLSDKEIDKIFQILPQYLQAKQDKQFRKDPERFLKHKVFNDEIIQPKKTKSGGMIMQKDQMQYTKDEWNILINETCKTAYERKEIYEKYSFDNLTNLWIRK